MALRSVPLLLLVLVAVALPESCFGSSLHSVKYLYTAMLDPSQGLPQFVFVGYVDDQVFSYYDSNSRKVQPRVSWVEELGKEHPQFWDTSTQKVRGTEEVFRVDLESMRTRYNQTEVPESNLGHIIGCIVAVVVLVIAVIVGILVYHKKRQEGYEETSTQLWGCRLPTWGERKEEQSTFC